MKQIIIKVSSFMTGIVLIAGMSSGLTSAQQNQNNAVNDKITICHSTQPNPSQGGGGGPQNNPYNVLSVDMNAADGIAGNQQGQGDHYAEHNGPLFNNTGQNYWGDIIPPIPGVHNGLNWTAAGQAIYNNECTYTVPETPKKHHKFQIVKAWDGDTIDLSNVSVTFYIDGKAWQPGDKPLPVKPGSVLSPLTEEVTGLPENCTYTSDLPESYTVPGNIIQSDASLTRIAVKKPIVHTLNVTNTVDCEEGGRGGEDPAPTTTTTTPSGHVLGAQVSATPTGAVNAGGGMDTSALLAGMAMSTLLIGGGVLFRKLQS